LTLISACGQKGPLYLPPKNGTVVTRPSEANAPPSQPSSQQPATPQNPDKKDDGTTAQPK
jgi:predicted small lipoprotein YifL